MKFRVTDQFLSGYFIGQICLAATRFFFTSPGRIISFLFLFWAFSQPGIKEDQHKNWSSKDLRYLKNGEISLEEKCDRTNIPSRTGQRVQRLMCSPAERWYAIKNTEENTHVDEGGFEAWKKRKRQVRSEYFHKKRWEKKNLDHPSIMESNQKSPRPVYVKELGWTIPNS